MAELIASPGKSNRRRSVHRMPLRVDLTAMVDLAFLLITFFMMTTTLAKPKSMDVVMPAPGPEGFVSEKSTMTICLGTNNKAVYFLGMPAKPLTTPQISGYGVQLRKAIVDMSKTIYASTGRKMMVVVKPAEHSRYEDLVNVLDELTITKVPSYAIAKITPKEIEILKAKGI